MKMEIDSTNNSEETPSRVRRTRNIPLMYRDNEIDIDMGSNSILRQRDVELWITLRALMMILC